MRKHLPIRKKVKNFSFSPAAKIQPTKARKEDSSDKDTGKLKAFSCDKVYSTEEPRRDILKSKSMYSSEFFLAAIASP